MSCAEKEISRLLQRKYRLPEQLRRARARLEALEREARLYSDDAILNDPQVTDQAWERAVETAQLEGMSK